VQLTVGLCLTFDYVSHESMKRFPDGCKETKKEDFKKLLKDEPRPTRDDTLSTSPLVKTKERLVKIKSQLYFALQNIETHIGWMHHLQFTKKPSNILSMDVAGKFYLNLSNVYRQIDATLTKNTPCDDLINPYQIPKRYTDCIEMFLQMKPKLLFGLSTDSVGATIYCKQWGPLKPSTWISRDKMEEDKRKKKMGIEITNVSTPPKGKFIGINTPSQIGVTLKNMDCDVYHGFDPGGAIIAFQARYTKFVPENSEDIPYQLDPDGFSSLTPGMINDFCGKTRDAREMEAQKKLPIVGYNNKSINDIEGEIIPCKPSSLWQHMEQ
jgi:hypothetical protein